MCSRRATLAALLLAAIAWDNAAAVDLPPNDYPTEARADYVFACMQVNGRSRETLRKCSCSIDVIASLLPYDEYEEVETILSVRQRGGEQSAIFFTPQMRTKIDELRRAQVEAELRCF
jgi:hypothetical protein